MTLRLAGVWTRQRQSCRYLRSRSGRPDCRPPVFEAILSLRRLRTTPARKPRTECCCQPVAFIIAAIVAPGGDCNIAMTRDCFERVSGLLALGSAVCCAAFAAGTGAGQDIAGRFLADLDIEILRSVRGGPRTTEAPPRRSNIRANVLDREAHLIPLKCGK